MKYKSVSDIYPLTIIRDRYSGVYSGGLFTAWDIEHNAIPDALCSNDVVCGLFFDKPIIYGVGDTPNDAALDLLAKLNKL